MAHIAYKGCNAFGGAALSLIDLSHTVQRRGAIEHRYTITPRGRALAQALKRLAATGRL